MRAPVDPGRAAAGLGIAAGYQLDIPELNYSTSGYESIQAATYTDMNAQLPAYQILTFVALAAAVLLLLNIWFRTLWALALAGGAGSCSPSWWAGCTQPSSRTSRSTRTS